MKVYWILALILYTLQCVSAQKPIYQQQLKLIPQAEQGDYGSAVDIEGDWVMVGAEDASVNGLSSGTVYVYAIDSGTPIFIKNIVPSDASNSNQFGNAISIKNSTMVVGAWARAGQSGGNSIFEAGKAYIYEEDQGGTDNWGEVKDLQAPVPAISENFGFSVDISENVIAISGHRNSDLAESAGKVYLYGRNIGGQDNWGFIKVITEVDAGENHQFGRWVEVSDDHLAVTSSNFNNQGKVHIYYKNEGGSNNWGHQKTIASDDPASNRFFGDETSLDGDELLIGGLREINTNFSNTGRAFLHQKDEGGINNWGLVQMFEPTVTESDLEYGNSVDLSGDDIIIGAEEESSTTGNDAGAAYIYHRNQGGSGNWGLVNRVFSCDSDDEDELGTAVAIKGGQAIIGADDDSEVVNNAGAAYFFQQSTNPLHVSNLLISTTNDLQYQSGLPLTSNAQLNIAGETARFKSNTSIELQSNFSIGASGVLECIIDQCN